MSDASPSSPSASAAPRLLPGTLVAGCLAQIGLAIP